MTAAWPSLRGPLKVVGKPRLIVSSSKVVDLLACDLASAQPLNENERLHHRLNEAVAKLTIRADLLQNLTAIFLTQAFQVLPYPSS